MRKTRTRRVHWLATALSAMTLSCWQGPASMAGASTVTALDIPTAIGVTVYGVSDDGRYVLYGAVTVPGEWATAHRP